MCPEDGTLELPLPDGTLMRYPAPDDIARIELYSLRPGTRLD
jgi:hypothetical protein